MDREWIQGRSFGGVASILMTAQGRQTFDAAHVPARRIAAELVAHLRPGEAGQLAALLTRFTYPPG